MIHDNQRPALVLFRHDLRLADNQALSAAAATGRPTCAAFVLDEVTPGIRPLGGARRWWLHHSLKRLAHDIEKLGIRLILRRGPMADVVLSLVTECDAAIVFWNRRYEPTAATVDTGMQAVLSGCGVESRCFEGQLLHEPSWLKTAAGGFYRVYSPFWRAFSAEPEPREPLPAPVSLIPHTHEIATDELDHWRLLPARRDWSGGLQERWTPGEARAHERLERFLDSAIHGYAEGRDHPGKTATSRLSPHLAHGEITPFQIWHALRGRGGKGPDRFRRELAWREFAWHLLHNRPDLARRNFNDAFDAFLWRQDPEALKAWQRGRTGYPIVDAGMHELWQTGWMHNRARMVCASFLVKHLMIDWRDGERWFWDTLVDADAANNPASWQWVAGSGADAAPFFRIFNPVLQGEKFDSEGTYVDRFLPSLARLPRKLVHRPWEAEQAQMAKAGVKLGTNFPVPLVDHQGARERALGAFRGLRDSK